jgi:hypothetical protein
MAETKTAKKQGSLLLQARGEVQDEVRHARLQRQSESRRRRDVASRIRARRLDRHRREKDRGAREEGDELRTEVATETATATRSRPGFTSRPAKHDYDGHPDLTGRLDTHPGCAGCIDSLTELDPKGERAVELVVGSRLETRV